MDEQIGDAAALSFSVSQKCAGSLRANRSELCEVFEDQDDTPGQIRE
jgi:hypothetical protein